MGSYHGLDGIKGGAADGPFVKATIADFRKGLRNARVCSTASDNGAITVWIDDAGKYRCELSRYLQSVASGEFDDFGETSKWLRRHLPMIERAVSATDRRSER